MTLPAMCDFSKRIGGIHTLCSSCISWNRQNLAAEQLLLEQAVRSSASISKQNQSSPFNFPSKLDRMSTRANTLCIFSVV
jgi:hypothetical protein